MAQVKTFSHECTPQTINVDASPCGEVSLEVGTEVLEWTDKETAVATLYAVITAIKNA